MDHAVILCFTYNTKSIAIVLIHGLMSTSVMVIARLEEVSLIKSKNIFDTAIFSCDLLTICWLSLQ